MTCAKFHWKTLKVRIQTLQEQKHGAKAVVVDYYVGRHGSSLAQAKEKATNDRGTSNHISKDLNQK